MPVIRIKQTGFTIIELLIVIVVIGILAAITIVSYNGIQDRAKVQAANSDVNTLAKAIKIARLSKGQVLGVITGNYCTNCGTQQSYESTLDKISLASGVNLSSLKKGDPWGNRYVIDENENEGGACRRDGLGVVNGTSHAGLVIPIIPTFAC